MRVSGGRGSAAWGFADDRFEGEVPCAEVRTLQGNPVGGAHRVGGGMPDVQRASAVGVPSGAPPVGVLVAPDDEAASDGDQGQTVPLVKVGGETVGFQRPL